MRDGQDNLPTQEDLEESIEVVIAGYQKKNADTSQIEEKRIVAYHEIGHALVAAKADQFGTGAEDHYRAQDFRSVGIHDAGGGRRSRI